MKGTEVELVLVRLNREKERGEEREEEKKRERRAREKALKNGLAE